MYASDEELLARQSALQAEAALLLDELDLAGRLGLAEPPLLAGSYVSGLMCWRDLDVMVRVGAACSPQRLAVLRIKDVWHRLPEYPDEVGGMDIYTAVLEHGVRTPDQFGAWLTARDGRTVSA